MVEMIKAYFFYQFSIALVKKKKKKELQLETQKRKKDKASKFLESAKLINNKNLI